MINTHRAQSIIQVCMESDPVHQKELLDYIAQFYSSAFLVEKLIKIISDRDINNVGMLHPDAIKEIEFLKKLKLS